MPKLILRCNYLKNAPPSHLQNFVQYIGTREGVEKVSDTTALLPATAKQKELIQDILNRIEDADRMHEYYDYIQKPTRENASEFITQALENNLDIIAKKKNYIDYLANRPRVERIGTHGLFLMQESRWCFPKWQRKWQAMRELSGPMSSVCEGKMQRDSAMTVQLSGRSCCGAGCRPLRRIIRSTAPT